MKITQIPPQRNCPLPSLGALSQLPGRQDGGGPLLQQSFRRGLIDLFDRKGLPLCIKDHKTTLAPPDPNLGTSLCILNLYSPPGI